jgi:hypothetical protein
MNSRSVTLHFHIDNMLVEIRRMVMVEMAIGERVRDAIESGARIYGQGNLYAFVLSIPHGAAEFTELPVGEDTLVTLIQASWVPAGVVMVGRNGRAVRPGQPVGRNAKYMEVANG